MLKRVIAAFKHPKSCGAATTSILDPLGVSWSGTSCAAMLIMLTAELAWTNLNRSIRVNRYE